jgi:hypothetical protein
MQAAHAGSKIPELGFAGFLCHAVEDFDSGGEIFQLVIRKRRGARGSRPGVYFIAA